MQTVLKQALAPLVLLALSACSPDAPGGQSANTNPSAGSSQGLGPTLATPAGARYLAHEVIVRPADEAAFAAELARIGARVISKPDNIVSRLLGYRRVLLPPTMDADAGIAALRAAGVAAIAERNYVVETTAQPDDPFASLQWALEKVALFDAWEVTTGDRAVVVAVSDTGVDYRHPDLAANIWTNPGEIAGNGIDDDGNGYVDDVHGYDFHNGDADPIDDNRHGTHVAGTIGAVGNNGAGVVGVNWRVSIQALKFLNNQGSGALWNGVATVLYAAEKKVRVVNASWGCNCYTAALEDAIETLREAGGLLVAAAGNNGSDSDKVPFYPAAHTNENVISVAASRSNETLAGFSNYGANSVDIAAPGDTIESTLPNGSYGYLSGTSMASPHVAGAAALALSLASTLDYRTLKDKLLASATRLPAYAGKVKSGGRLEVAALLASVIDRGAPGAPTGVSAEAGKRNDMTVRWQPSGYSDLGMYIVRWGTRSGVYTQERSVDKGETTLRITGLESGVRVYAVVVAVSSSANRSAPSAEVSALPSDATAPPQVIDLEARAMLGGLIAGSVAAASGELSSHWAASNAYDGSPLTAWISPPRDSARAEYIVLDLLSPRSLDHVALLPNPAYPAFFPTDFDIEVSDDASSWRVVAGKRGYSATKGTWLTLTFPAQRANYVRLHSLRGAAHPAGAYYTSVGEVQVRSVSQRVDALELRFTAPGDDPGEGSATRYDLRFSKSPITESNFAHATPVPLSQQPAAAGVREQIVVGGLDAETTYYFALRASDEAGNASPMSNVAKGTTIVVPPSTITDLSVSGSDKHSVSLQWSAPGADATVGQAKSYDLRVSKQPITAASFYSATQVSGLPLPGPAGTREKFDVTGLDDGDLYYFAIRAIDRGGAVGGISNIVTAVPNYGKDETPPATIGDLTANTSSEDVVVAGARVVDRSSEYSASYPAENAIDGAIGTRWISAWGGETRAEWITLDLGAVKPLARFRLHAPTIPGFFSVLPRDFAWQASADSINWTTLVDVQGLLIKNNTWQSHAAPTTYARYVRMYIARRQTTGLTQLGELEVRALRNPGDVVLSWSAPGDDGWVGTATAYELRRSSSPIDEHNFEHAVPIPTATPQPAGLIEHIFVRDLALEQSHYFAIRAVDDANNRGKLSTVVRIEMPAVPPAAVTDLRAANPTTSSIELSWTASGDDGDQGTAHSYDLRYDTKPITVKSWSDATRVLGVPAPKAAGSAERFTVAGLSSNTVYYFALMVRDERAASSLMSNVAEGATSDGIPPAAVTTLVATVVDPQQAPPLALSVLSSSGNYSEAYSADKLLDGDASTAWLSPGRSTSQSEHVVLGLASKTNLGRIRLRAASSYLDLFPVGFVVEVRAKDTDPWTTVVAEQSFSAGSGWQEWSLGAVPALQVRVRALEGGVWTGQHFVAIADVELYADPSDYTTIRLSWTAPGDDGNVGKAASYDVRHAPSPINSNAAWRSATAIASPPTPKVAGSLERFEVRDLSPQTTYCFALESADQAANRSALSNSSCATTPGIPPATITDLRVESVSTGSATLAWTAVGADGHAGGAAARYELRYSTQRITSATWNSATPAGVLPTPSAPGQTDRATVSSLAAVTRYYFAVRAVDAQSAAGALSNNASATTRDGTPPTTVTDLGALTFSDASGAIALGWTAPSDNSNGGRAALYDLRVSTAPITAANFAAARAIATAAPGLAGASEQALASGLEPETLYYAALISRDSEGNASALSNVASARTRDEPPAAVGDLAIVGATGAALGQATLLLRWHAPGDDGTTGTAQSYEMRYSTKPIGAHNFAAATAVTLPAPRPAGALESATISGLTPGTRYYVALRSRDERANLSALSNVASGETPDGVAPSALDDLVASTGSTCNGCLELRWTERGDNGGTARVDSYDLRWSTKPITPASFGSATAAAPSPWADTVGKLRTFLLSSLPDEQQIWVAMRAKDAAGNWSAISNVASAWTPNIPPRAVIDLAQSDKSAASVTVRWTAPGDDGAKGTATRYDVRYASAPITAANFAAATAVQGPTPLVGGSTQTLVVSGLAADKTYYVALKAVDDRGSWSPLSNVARVVTRDTTAPAAVKNLAAQTGATTGTIQLSWTAPGDDGDKGTATRYEVRRSSAPISSATWASATPVAGAPTPTAAGSSQWMVVRDLVGETTYHFAMRAMDDDSNTGPISASVSAMTPPVAPGAVKDLVAQAARGGVATLTWTAPGDDGDQGTATSYEIRYSKQPLSSALFHEATLVPTPPTPTPAGTPQSVTVSGLAEQTKYYFAMRAKDDQGAVSALSNVATATTPDETAPGAPASLTVQPASTEGLVLFASSAHASSTLSQSWKASYAVDDDLATAWASAGATVPTVHTLTIDLGQITDVGALRLRPDAMFVSLFPRGFELQVSTDQQTFSTVVREEQFSVDSSAPLGWGFAPRSARYVRLEVFDQARSAGVYYALLAELEAAAPPPRRGRVTLSWIAPGDDNARGKATRYEVYRHSASFDASTLRQATLLAGAPSPALAGALQTMTVDDMPGETTYYWAVRAIDEDGNVGPLSSVVEQATNAVAPAAVSDLSASASNMTSVTLSWHAPGDDADQGSAHSYELRYAAWSITSASFPLATLASNVPAPAVAGTQQSVRIDGLDPGTTYRFALVARDEAGTTSSLSNVLVAATTPAPDSVAPAAVSDLSAQLPQSGDKALSASVTSFSGEQLPGFPAAALSDGNPATAWSSPAETSPGRSHTATIDLGQAISIGRVRARPAPGLEALFPPNVEIKVSADGLAWQSVLLRSGVSLGAGATLDGQFPSTTARYVRLDALRLAASNNGLYYAVVAELEVLPPAATPGTVIVSWTASGDDGAAGQAEAYDLRIGSCPYQHQNATVVLTQPPLQSGAPERLLISGLASGQYCLGLRVRDEASNHSALSNVVSITVP